MSGHTFKPAEDPQPMPGVEPGDHVYFQHKHGPKSGKVLSAGKHGATVEAEGARHQVHWHHVLGHKERMQHQMELVDKGEDGAIVKDEKGKHKFMAGDVPDAEGYLDPLAALDDVEDGQLVTRQIESAVRGVRSYQVLAGKLPAGTVLVGESADSAPELLHGLEKAGMTVPYEVVARTLVEGDSETHGVLLAFSPESKALQGFLNAVAGLQRRTALDVDDILVLGKPVNGMQPVTLSSKTLGGKTVLVMGELDNFEQQSAFASKKMIEGINMAKSMVLFLKASQIKNRPGLALQDVMDKSGKQTKRWKKTGSEAPAEQKSARTVSEKEDAGSAKGFGTNLTEVGDKVAFDTNGHRVEGAVTHKGESGVTVDDERGGEHKVVWKDLKAPSEKKKSSQAMPRERRVLGKQEPVPRDSFSALDFYKSHNDEHITPDDVLKDFPTDTKDKIKEVQDRLKTVEETIITYKKNGVYSDERLEKHKAIIDHYLNQKSIEAATPKDGQKPIFTILGGRGGSGKSWFEHNVFKPSENIVLDADAIKGMLDEYQGWNAQQVHEESGDLFDRITELAKDAGLNIVHDATMKTKEKAIKLAQAFKDDGYSLEAHYMPLPRHEAASRAIGRFLGEKGRFVPPEVILGNTGNEDSFDAVRAIADKWSFRDNKVGKGEQPILISESENGQASEKSNERLGKSQCGQAGLYGLPGRQYLPGGEQGSHTQPGYESGNRKAPENCHKVNRPTSLEKSFYGSLAGAILFFKAHIRGYVRKDGTTVKPHETRVPSAKQEVTADQMRLSFDAHAKPHKPVERLMINKPILFFKEPKKSLEEKQSMFVHFAGNKYPVESLKDASEKWESVRDLTGIGASTMPTSPLVKDGAGKILGYIAYNGRIFAGESGTNTYEVLYDNRTA